MTPSRDLDYAAAMIAKVARMAAYEAERDRWDEPTTITLPRGVLRQMARGMGPESTVGRRIREQL